MGKILKHLRAAAILISVLSIGLILCFDCTHRLWVFSECIAVQRVIDEAFSFRNLGDWLWCTAPILLANLGVFFRLKCFGRWYDFVYLIRCLFGIFMSVVVLSIEIPWDGVVHTFENEHPYEFLYFHSLLLLIFILLPSDLILFAVSLFKRLRKSTN